MFGIYNYYRDYNEVMCGGTAWSQLP